MSARVDDGTPPPASCEQDCQVAIAGAGPVGMSLALALGRAGVRVALVESSAAHGRADAGHGARPIALSEGSRRVLDALDAWNSIAAIATPIKRIHVSDRGHFGFARLRAEDCCVDALGYVVAAAELEQALESALRSMHVVRVLRPARVTDIERDQGPVARLSVVPAGDETGEAMPSRLRASLVVLCDGGRSALRERLGIAVSERDYAQWAVTARLEARCAHGGVAYERFTSDGPLALLPMGGKHCGLVWSVDAATSEHLVSLDDDAFLAALTDRFGMRLGGFTSAAPRSAFPLSLITAGRVVGERLAIIGNAAHHLHPVAGQGLNLGLRDAAALAEIVTRCVREDGDPGDANALAHYAEWRRRDQKLVTGATDALVRLFSTGFPPIVAVRGLGLLAFDLLPPVKRRFAIHAMGLAGRQSRLARGLLL